MSDPLASSDRCGGDHRRQREHVAAVPGAGRRPPWLLLLILFVVAASVLARCLALQGWIRPVRIVGGSMAEAFFGDRYQLRCDDCGFPFSCGVDLPPRDDLAVCPNCGYCRNRVHARALVPGQRVLIDRWRGVLSRLQNGQVIAYRSATDNDFLAVKRIAAAGAGRVAICDGDLWVDGQIQRKSLKQLHEVSILVHDDDFRPVGDPTLPPRWQAASDDSPWHATPSGYRFSPSDRAPAEVEWLEYVQWVCWPYASPPRPRTSASSILDHYGHNQGLSRGTLRRVTDLLLQCDVEATGTGRLLVQIASAGDDFQLELACNPARVRLLANDQTVWQVPAAQFAQPWHLELAVCDRQVLAAINGIDLPRYAFEPAALATEPPTAPVAVGAVQMQVELSALRIYRDLYYLGPLGEQHWEAPYLLQPDQVFVLGDNVPVSVDSRRIGPVKREQILGPIVPLLW